MTNPIQVLVIEDDAGLREGLRTILGATPGMRCVGAFGSARVALKAEAGLGADVIVLDLDLPGMSGVEFLCQRRRGSPGVAEVLVLTIHSEPEWLFPALEAGAGGYLIKPVEPARFIEAIRELRAGGAPMSGPIARRVLREFRSARGNQRDLEQLTARESEVLQALARGRRYEEIAAELAVSRATVATHIHHIYEKLHVRSAAAATARYWERRSDV